jgi:molecular chaperone GrpE
MRDNDKKDEQEYEEDIQIEESDLDDSVVAEENATSALKKLKDRLKASEEKAKEYLDLWQRDKADFLNLRRRDEEDRKDFVKYANENLVLELIPVLDSFNIAIASGHKDMEPIYNQLFKALKSRGLEEINPEKIAFDPNFHEAIGLVPTKNKKEDQLILEVVQRGYKLSGKVLRPAQVRIGEFNS